MRDQPRGEPQALPARILAFDWTRAEAELDAEGHTVLGGLLTADECTESAALYDRDDLFRDRVVMARHGFGRGEYKYFAYPLPTLVAELRASLYPRLVPTANRWSAALGEGACFPETHDAFLECCHAAGQSRPTPLLLSYAADDFNCLHQDLYGEHVFPIQAAILLAEPGRAFAGGEFVMTEQRPRKQSRAIVVGLRQGDAVLFAVRHRPARGVRGIHRVTMRHGVSRVLSGTRRTMGVIFHDAA
ncbi:MAG TPA: 2OG-Fe(II) oxygenase [Polyangiaceae bacterium]|jgi:hypothetical protein